MSGSKEKPAARKQRYNSLPHKTFPEDLAGPATVRDYIAWLLERGQEYTTEEAKAVASKWENRMGHELMGLSADELGSVLGSQYIRGLLFMRHQAAKSREIRKPKEISMTGPYIFLIVIAMFYWTDLVLNRLQGIVAAGRPRTCR